MKKLSMMLMWLAISGWLFTANCQAQPAGGFGGFQAPQVNLETSQQWKDVNYAGDDKPYHTCDIYLPKQEKASYPVVIHIYGSAWFSNSSKGMADLGTIVKSLLDAGYAVVCPNHRSSMDAKWPAQIHDIRAVVRFVRGEAKKYKFDTSFIATSGFSSGGHLASITATTSGTKQAKVGTVDIDLEGTVGNYTNESSVVNAACDWSGPVDLTAMDCGEHMTMGENSPEDVLLNAKLDKEPDKYLSLSATQYVNKQNPPIIIFHGEKDNVVPCCQGKKFYELLKAAGVKTEAPILSRLRSWALHMARIPSRNLAVAAWAAARRFSSNSFLSEMEPMVSSAFFSASARSFAAFSRASDSISWASFCAERMDLFRADSLLRYSSILSTRTFILPLRTVTSFWELVISSASCSRNSSTCAIS